jgi:NADPH:quinone reductase-like Zn-dependent oxidoreductase
LILRVIRALKPANLSHVQAVVVPLAALTAWQAPFEKAGLKAGQTQPLERSV